VRDHIGLVVGSFEFAILGPCSIRYEQNGGKKRSDRQVEFNESAAFAVHNPPPVK